MFSARSHQWWFENEDVAVWSWLSVWALGSLDQCAFGWTSPLPLFLSAEEDFVFVCINTVTVLGFCIPDQAMLLREAVNSLGCEDGPRF